MLDLRQCRVYLVRPVLARLGAYSRTAENLVVGTAVQESRLRFLRQLQDGPARGLYQMEPDTHDDIWDNYLAYRSELRESVESFLAASQNKVEQLVWNFAYATAMCRVHYLRVPHPLPDADDIEGLAAYWKRHYNTELGRGTIEEFVRHYEAYVIRSAED